MPVFDAIIFKHDQFELGAWSWIEMPFNASEIFGKKGNIPVVAKIDEITFRGTLMPTVKFGHLLIINNDLQKKIRKQAGMSVRASIEIDAEPRPLEIYEDMEDALENNLGAKTFFYETIPISHRKGLMTWLNGAKTVETRMKRIDKIIEVMTYWNKRGERPKAGESIFKIND
jgi:Domain of unknown function (DUF1905)/Bacteriocin-protection, YdeI or OmpD-Associated